MKKYYDLVYLSIFSILTFILMGYLDAYEYIYELTRKYEHLELDKVFVAIIPISVAAVVFAYFRYKKSVALQNEIVTMLRTDKDSGLLNKKIFNEDLESSEIKVIVLFKIANFESIHSTFGLEFSEKVLLQAINLIDTLTTERFKSTLYRLEGNLFAIALKKESSIKTNKTIKSQIISLQQKFNSTPLGNENSEIYLTLISGYSKSNPLLNTAKVALNLSKKRSGVTITKYIPERVDAQQQLNKILLLAVIKQAITDDRVVVFFQPIVDNNTQKIIKHEALVRIIDSQGELISPADFLPLAMKFKLYPFLTEVVIKKSFECFINREDSFSINLSKDDLDNESTMEYLCDTLKRYPSCAKRLTVEIVETKKLNAKALIKFKQKLNFHGVKLALDDFGSGYSNWGVLLELAPDFIKIDGSLITKINTHKDVDIAVRAIVDIAKLLSIKIIAEFVSSAEIYQAVCKLGIDYSQGYFFSPPTKAPTSDLKTKEI